MENEELTTGLKARVTRVLNELKVEFRKSMVEITSFRDELLIDTSDKSSLKTQVNSTKKEIDDILNTAKTKQEEINNLYDYFFGIEENDEDDEDDESVEDKLKRYETEIKTSYDSVILKKDELDKFYIKIFGTKDEKGNVLSGLSLEIDTKIKKLDDLHDQKEKEYTTLFKKIESLLPGATSTGLAKAYQDQKKSYYKPSIVWSSIFVFTMCFMIGYSIYTFHDATSPSDALSKVINKLPFLIPTIWLGVFAGKQQSQNKRLTQEYAHKESLAKSFEGFKKQIEDLGQSDKNNAILLDLMKNVIAMAGYNPSETLDIQTHREEPPLLNKVSNYFTRTKA